MGRLGVVPGLVLEWACVLLAIGLTVLRVHVRRNYQCLPLSWVEYFTILGLFLFVYVSLSNLASHFLGTWNNPNIRFTGVEIIDPSVPLPPDRNIIISYKLFYVAGPIYYAALWAMKGAFLSMYYQLLSNGMPRMRTILHLVTTFTVVSLLIQLGLNLFSCIPVNRNWSLDRNYACFAFPQKSSWFTTLALHLATDAMIFALPFLLLRKLQLSTRTKFGVGCMFALGAVCIMCTVARAITVATTFAMPVIGAWTAAEVVAAIAVICAPPIRLLVMHKRHERHAEGSLEGRNNRPKHRRIVSSVREIVGTSARTIFGTTSNGRLTADAGRVTEIGHSKNREGMDARGTDPEKDLNIRCSASA